MPILLPGYVLIGFSVLLALSVIMLATSTIRGQRSWPFAGPCYHG